MNNQTFSEGKERTEVSLTSYYFGKDLIICVYNQNPHIGAVAIADYERESGRTSTSVVTRTGHKDDTVAREVAYRVTKATTKPCCVVAGIHIENITKNEISEILENVDIVTERFTKQLNMT
jgi:hypothetical protein